MKKEKKEYIERIVDYVIKHQFVRHSVRYFDVAFDQLKKEGRGAIVISLHNAKKAFDPMILEGAYVDQEKENENISIRYDTEQWFRKAEYDNVVELVEQYNPEYEFVAVCEIKNNDNKMTVKPVVIHRNTDNRFLIFEKDCFVCGKDLQNRIPFFCNHCHIISYCTKECWEKDRKRGHHTSSFLL